MQFRGKFLRHAELAVNIRSTNGLALGGMASLRTRHRKDGTNFYSVLYRLNGKQSSLSFDDFTSASRFCNLANKFGPENALATLTDASPDSQTVEEWITHYIDHTTGIQPDTVTKYRAYLRNDIAPVLGGIPLTALSRDHVAKWVNTMHEPDDHGRRAKAKTVANKHGFLAGALNAAVPKHIPANPCIGIRLPREEVPEAVFLTEEQFAKLLAAVTEPWRLLVEFLVASGCRLGEALALRPGDVDRDAGTVSITRAWKYDSVAGYFLGPPKTPKSRRTINVDVPTLDKLDYSHEYLFVNREGGPVRGGGFNKRVWAPALKRAWPSVGSEGERATNPAAGVLRPRVHDLRHTSASWMIKNGTKLPVIQRHLGHESIQTTIDRYGHLERDAMEDAARAIGESMRAVEGWQPEV